MVRLWGTDLFKLTWMRFPHSVRTGQSAQEYLYGLRQFDYLATQPEVAAIFNDGMLAGTLTVAAAALDAYDFSAFRSIVDVGGGSGALAATVLKANPTLRGSVFDLPFCRVLPPVGGPLTDAVFGDVTMIVHTGGRERTQAEYAGLLESAGFRLRRVVPTRVAQSVVEAVPN
ncbi:MAG: hypothetical protein JO352_37105 [Chloroflexi bacterium]|nr:hypothetical protein [Chloroflexota bacterium]